MYKSYQAIDGLRQSICPLSIVPGPDYNAFAYLHLAIDVLTVASAGSCYLDRPTHEEQQ